MPCNPIVEKGRVVGFTCTRGARAPGCQEPGCIERSVALCDWPLTYGDENNLHPVRPTCSRRMCAHHRNKQPDGRDFCGPHHRRAEGGLT